MAQFECSLSFTYEADSPEDAARQFIANIQSNPNWFVDVKNLENGKTATIDTEEILNKA